MQAEYKQSEPDSQTGPRINLRPTKNPSVFRIELRLGFKTVYPGKLDFSGEGYFRSKRKPEHLHRRLNSWGVNAAVVEQHEFRWISILCDGKEYLTSRDFMLRFGKKLTYDHYETQFFLPLELWGVEAVRAFEGNNTMKHQILSIIPANGAA